MRQARLSLIFCGLAPPRLASKASCRNRANLLEYKNVALKELYKNLALEKNKTIIKEMKTSKGDVVKKTHEINEHIFEFYKNLYSAQGANVSTQIHF